MKAYLTPCKYPANGAMVIALEEKYTPEVSKLSGASLTPMTILAKPARKLNYENTVPHIEKSINISSQV